MCLVKFDLMEAQEEAVPLYGKTAAIYPKKTDMAGLTALK